MNKKKDRIKVSITGKLRKPKIIVGLNNQINQKRALYKELVKSGSRRSIVTLTTRLISLITQRKGD